ncbi:hypothetical protein ACFV2L_00580 [Streptomyces sp. NPDC059687]|uniref:hypothetical protein n=1 Tax=Streptomyces sp. NPDC059687 TaxID=3346905 RepID=UPI0036C6D323
MSSYVLPLLATAAAFGLTYVFCIRPMRQGNGCPMPQRQSQAGTQTQTYGAATDADPSDATDAEIKRLREEVQLLHHELDLSSTAAKPPAGGRLRKGDPR